MSFSETQLRRMRIQATASMHDTAAVLSYSAGAADAHNRSQPVFTQQAVISCGIKQAVNKEVQAAGDVIMVDYVIRIPYATAVSREDRILVVSRYGVADFRQITCEIIGEVEAGVSAKVLNLKEVVNG